MIPNTFAINSERLYYLYSNLISATVGSLVLSLIVFFTLYGSVDIQLLSLWIVSNSVLSILRVRLSKKYEKETITQSNIKKYYQKYTIYLFLSGLVWSGLVLFLLPSDLEKQLLVTLIISGLITGATMSLASSHRLYMMFMFVSISPLLYVFTTVESELKSSILLIIAFYMGFIIIVSKKIYKVTMSRIILVAENELLIEKLQQKVDEANHANEAKSRFLSVMSHEIRTPLNAIVGFVKVLKKMESDAKKINYLDTIDKSSYLLMSVINDILDVSKIESGSFKIESVEFHTKEEIEDIYTLYLVNAEQVGSQLINSISSNLPQSSKGDILRLKQILSNLLSNAIKFTPKGKNIELIVRFDYESSKLYVEVKDEGIGIAQEEIENMTKEFTQADCSTARKYGGSGLGLSIVTKLLELQNSELHIESELGSGSRFFFELYLDIVETQKSRDEESEISFHGKKILVAEDNKTNQMLIELLLEDMDIEVTVANDGLEAEELFEPKKFDLILMDINMPNKNGSEAMQSIKERDKTIPIIALTANSINGDREKYIAEGFDDYISKPIDVNTLEAVLVNSFSI